MLGNKSHFIHAGNLKCIYAFFFRHKGNLTFDKRESLSVVALLNLDCIILKGQSMDIRKMSEDGFLLFYTYINEVFLQNMAPLVL